MPNGAYVRSIKRTIRALIPHVSEDRRLVCNVDGRADYLAAVRETGLGLKIKLRIFPNPKRGPKGSARSPEAIARDQAMAPADNLHQPLRHSCSDHKRETIAFGRRLESIIGRAHLMTVWRNFIKSRSERRPDRTSPAMRLGLTDTRWRWERILSRRLFPEREPISKSAAKLYRKRWTSSLPVLNRKHAA